MPAQGFRVIPSTIPGRPGIVEPLGKLQLWPSSLCPDCPADERIFQWRGVLTPASPTISDPLIQYLADAASRTSLRESTVSGYGSGLRKFHLFCDIFSIPEREHLPASFQLLHSFALWAVAEPNPAEPVFSLGTPSNPLL
ncbi:hypothetical protein A0H81_06081 [Grifola frondosa]|uniref:Core-binding (CB) domain-containing protein n=1 Tax=Grifola frondosa TaxID=5627 RepID=A0A1C7M9Q0_GRIFR|nr:hypothetical protein A0H81_06081 [Grifola frondosa]